MLICVLRCSSFAFERLWACRFETINTILFNLCFSAHVRISRQEAHPRARRQPTRESLTSPLTHNDLQLPPANCRKILFASNFFSRSPHNRNSPVNRCRLSISPACETPHRRLCRRGLRTPIPRDSPDSGLTPESKDAGVRPFPSPRHPLPLRSTHFALGSGFVSLSFSEGTAPDSGTVTVAWAVNAALTIPGLRSCSAVRGA